MTVRTPIIDTPKRTVRFDVPDAARLAKLVAELRRLGRTELDWGLNGESDGGWIRLDNPPTALLLHAEIDPFIRIHDDRPLDSAFRSNRSRFALTASTATPASERAQSIVIVPRLSADQDGATAELWVIDDDPDRRLCAWLAQTDDQLLMRLQAARVDIGGRSVIVLAARASRDGPPLILLDEAAYRSYLKMPNLFVPVGKKLSPPLRRDLLRKAYAADAERLVYLDDSPRGLVATSIPLNAFRPLPQMVRYVAPTVAVHVPQEFAPLIVPEPFVVKDRPTPARLKPVALPRQPDATADGPTVWQALFAWVKGAWSLTTRAAPNDESTQPLAPNTTAVDATADLEQALRREIAAHGHVQNPRQWAEFAQAAFFAGRANDAATGWILALWPNRELPTEWVASWANAEAANAGQPQDVNAWIAEPTPPRVRALAAALVQEATTNADWLHVAYTVICAHENSLSIRAAWLVHRSRYAVTGDALALARARDRLLERLYEFGLRTDLDVPAFLFASRDDGRNRSTREWLSSASPLIHRWLGAKANTARRGPFLTDFGLARERVNTPAYADLIIGVGLARIGDALAAQTYRSKTQDRLPADPVHEWLTTAFSERIEQAAAGRAARGGWSPALVQQRAQLTDAQRYAVDKLRQHMRVLEPPGSVDAFAAYRDGVESQLQQLATSADRAEFRRRCDELLDSGHAYRRDQLRILAAALPHAPRFGADITRDLLSRLSALLAPFTGHDLQLIGLIRGWWAAGAAGLDDSIARLVEITTNALSRENMTAVAVHDVVTACAPVLTEHNLANELAIILDRADELLPTDDPAALTAQLAVATARVFLGNLPATTVDDARQRILAGPAASDLLLAYVRAIGSLPSPAQRLDELLSRVAVPNTTSTTDGWYSLSALQLIDTIVVALTEGRDDKGAVLNQWRHVDELAVRSRIQNDMASVD